MDTGKKGVKEEEGDGVGGEEGVMSGKEACEVLVVEEGETKLGAMKIVGW